MCLLSWLCMTGKGLPLLLVDDIFLAPAVLSSSRSRRLLPLKSLKGRNPANTVTPFMISPRRILHSPSITKRTIAPATKRPFAFPMATRPSRRMPFTCAAKRRNWRMLSTSCSTHMNTAMTISHSMVSPLSSRSFIQQNFCGLLIRDEDIDIAAAQRSENRGHLLARCRHADAAAEAAEAFKLDGNFCFPDKLTITRTAVDCKKKSRALKESQLFF